MNVANSIVEGLAIKGVSDVEWVVQPATDWRPLDVEKVLTLADVREVFRAMEMRVDVARNPGMARLCQSPPAQPEGKE